MAAGRTLFGAKPSKGQEFDDHYFGAIPERVLAYMIEVDRELFKRGIPAKTRHNEVAPGQFEIAPLFEKANLAHDHQQLMMTTLKQVAERYDMTCLLHEKPFAGVNGSGKHVNFSIGNADQGNLLNPGDTPHENAAVPGLLRRDHPRRAQVRRPAPRRGRLGQQRLPARGQRGTAGDHLDLPRRSADGRVRRRSPRAAPPAPRSSGTLTVGVDTLPSCRGDPGDRNRTSPFAFTGNRFEFRAPGSSQVDLRPDGRGEHPAGRVDRPTSPPSWRGWWPRAPTSTRPCRRCCRTSSPSTVPSVFDGDGYSEAWQTEAAARGLPNLRRRPGRGAAAVG